MHVSVCKNKGKTYSLRTFMKSAMQRNIFSLKAFFEFMKMGQISSLFLLLLVGSIMGCEKSESTPSAPFNRFQKTYGTNTDEFVRGAVFHNGFLYIVGTTFHVAEPNGDIYLLQLDLDGELIAEHHFGGAAAEEGFEIVAAPNGNLLLCGATESSGAGAKDIYVLEVTPQGTLVWEQTYGGSGDDFPSDILVTNAGGIRVWGTTTSFGNGQRDMYLLHLDTQGNQQISTTYGRSGMEGGSELLELPTGELLLKGYVEPNAAESRNFVLMRTSALGDSLWSQEYGGDDYEESQALVATPDGSYLMHGHSASTDIHHNMLGVKVAPDGTELWQRNFGGTMHDGGQAACVTSRGRYVFIGRSGSYGAGMEDIYRVTTDAEGRIISSGTFGGAGMERADVVLEANGALYIVGYSNSFGAGDYDVFVIKTTLD